jgi:truncated hemoglobin YjbI
MEAVVARDDQEERERLVAREKKKREREAWLEMFRSSSADRSAVACPDESGVEIRHTLSRVARFSMVHIFQSGK